MIKIWFRWNGESEIMSVKTTGGGLVRFRHHLGDKVTILKIRQLETV